MSNRERLASLERRITECAHRHGLVTHFHLAKQKDVVGFRFGLVGKQGSPIGLLVTVNVR